MISAEGSDFSTAAQGAFTYLRSKLGFDLWMVTRNEGNLWMILQADDRSYGLMPHAAFPWDESLCARMAAGLGPRIAPRVASVPAYMSAPILRVIPIAAYAGVPLRYHDGELFGTLCALDPKPQPEAIEQELPLLEMVAGMLGGVLTAELKTVEAERERERILAEPETDLLTGLFNSSGWDRLLAIEEARCRRYGNAACVVLIDLDGLNAVNKVRGEAVGDKIIRRAGRVLVKTVRASDIVARIGGDKFAVLGVQCEPRSAHVLAQRVRREMERAGINASVGMSSRVPALQLEQVWQEADDRLLDDKISRKLRKSALDARNLSRSQIFRPKPL